MAGKEKETEKKPRNGKLTLDKMVEATGENYSVIIGALVNGGLQNEMENQVLDIRFGKDIKGLVTKAELKKMISDFKNKEL
jgi:hypothetical protein